MNDYIASMQDYERGALADKIVDMFLNHQSTSTTAIRDQQNGSTVKERR